MAIESQKNSRSTSQRCCCTRESNRSLPIVFGNLTSFNAGTGLTTA
ncbi:uncharacterized protein G2W53_010264 [Senna tora]|uniref:Uncharacterized protein n=1 Tax=Senna tora TaxID=362788 RepID=A0A834X0C6_9FABA|nr:uncharacterized protein G2W53_010264 [Senna tora]